MESGEIMRFVFEPVIRAIRVIRVENLKSQIPPQNSPGDGTFMHFVGAVVDAGGAFVAEPVGQRQFVRHPHRAVRLDGAVQNAPQYPGHVEFDERNFVAGGIRSLAVYFVGGVEGHQAGGVDFGAALGDPVLDGLLVG